MTISKKHAWIVGLGLLLPACGDDGVVGPTSEGATGTDGTETATTDPSTTLTTAPGDTTESADDTSADDTSADDTSADDTSADDTSADDTSADDTSADDTSADDTSADDTSADDTSADDTATDATDATDDTAGETTTGGESTGTTGEPECTQNEDCAALDDACNLGICEQGECVADPLDDGEACETDPGNMCITDEVCTAGVCGGGDVVDCEAYDDQCLVGVCNPNDGLCEAQAANEGMDCDDGDICTYGDVCVQGVCEGTDDPIFFETFGDNSQGWTLEGKWEIAATIDGATGSITQLTDPEFDHTGDAANGVAGVVISDTQGDGGLSGPPSHDAQFLESPVIDLSVLHEDAPKELRFWRWLVNQDLWMIDTVDAWNGTEWVNIWTPPGTVLDQAWFEMVFDISEYDNDDFRVRFGHEYDAFQLGGPSEPSWSIDDLSVGPACNGGNQDQ